MKKLLTILVLIMLIISFFQITSMYALYREQLQDEYSTLLGLWTIKVNESDVTAGGQTATFTISDDQLEYVESEYVQEGNIAPGSQAYVDLVIDPTNTDVSIVYTIDIGEVAVGSNNVSNANIELVSASNYFKLDAEDETETPVTNTTENMDGNSYTSVIPIGKITQGYKNFVRLYFEWVNVEANNETDSELASSEQVVEVEGEEPTTSSATLAIPVQINLKQYTGEVIGNES